MLGAAGDDEDGWRSGSVYRFSVPLFEDGFETGDTTRWFVTIPGYGVTSDTRDPAPPPDRCDAEYRKAL